jgi:hypothetical protein
MIRIRSSKDHEPDDRLGFAERLLFSMAVIAIAVLEI